MAKKESGAQTSIYLNAEDHEVLAAIQSRTGLGRSGAVRWALHNSYAEGEFDQVERMVKIRTAAEAIVSLTQT